jgi:hypothetical protein
MHRLQDQYYDLRQLFARAAGNGDYEEAIRALIEGNATVSMGLYARAHLTAMDIASYQLESVQSMDFSGIVSPGSGPLTESAAGQPGRAPGRRDTHALAAGRPAVLPQPCRPGGAGAACA